MFSPSRTTARLRYFRRWYGRWAHTSARCLANVGQIARLNLLEYHA